MSRHRVRISIVARFSLAVVFLFSAVAPVPALAGSLAAEGAAGEDPPEEDGGLEAGLTLGARDVHAEKVPLLSEGIAAQADPVQPLPPRLKVSAEPAIYIPAGTIRLQWIVQNIAAENVGSTSVIVHAPPGFELVYPNETLSPDHSLTVPLQGEGGSSVWRAGQGAAFPAVFTFDLSIGAELVNYAAVMVDQARFSVEKGRAGALAA